MKAKIAITFLALIALISLLGCVQEDQGQPSGIIPPAGGSQVQPSEEQVIGPEYYDSEQEAFNALDQELEGIPDASEEDLEALLGE